MSPQPPYRLTRIPHEPFKPLMTNLEASLKQKIDQKTKPIGALGSLETLALQLGKIQNTLEPEIRLPVLYILAADHGIAREGVSAYPQEVTYQMVLNFLRGGAAVNILALQHAMDLRIVDAGVKFDFGVHPMLIARKVGMGTESFLHGPAMTQNQVLECLAHGAELALESVHRGSNLIAFGEMGIGNTSSSTVLTHLLTATPLEQCTGSGTGLDSGGVQQKIKTLNQSLQRFHRSFPDPDLMDVLMNFGGFEILMISGAMLEAAKHRMVILVDGFITTAALLCAIAIDPQVLDYAVFSHLSSEKGHQFQLAFLKAKPLLQLDLRLGEGTGAVLALPLLYSAVNILNQMASFESAGVSEKTI